MEKLRPGGAASAEVTLYDWYSLCPWPGLPLPWALFPLFPHILFILPHGLPHPGHYPGAPPGPRPSPDLAFPPLCSLLAPSPSDPTSLVTSPPANLRSPACDWGHPPRACLFYLVLPPSCGGAAAPIFPVSWPSLKLHMLSHLLRWGPSLCLLGLTLVSYLE